MSAISFGVYISREEKKKEEKDEVEILPSVFVSFYEAVDKHLHPIRTCR